MNTINYSDRNVMENYCTFFNTLSVSSRIELIEEILKSLKNDVNAIPLKADEFIPEKSAEQIISEIKRSRCFGKTRIIETF